MYPGDAAATLNLSKPRLCPEDSLEVECTSRNTSLVEWSSNSSETFIITCDKNDPPIRNIKVGSIRVSIRRNYVSITSVLICNLRVEARELPKNLPLTYTCLNVDIGVTASGSVEVAGTYTVSQYNFTK